MNISLIYVQTIEGNNVNPPLGVMYIAAVLKKAGYAVQFLDVDPTVINVAGKVRNFGPDLIGLSFLTTEFEKAKNLSHELKTTFPGTVLCCGGVHTTLDTENVLRNFSVDFCVVGEGEMTLKEICERLEQKQPYDDIHGISFLKNGQLMRTPARKLIENLDSLPFPARDLVEFSRIYLTFPGCIKGSYVRSTALIAGRGCNFSCSYCASPKLNERRYRVRSPQNVVEEIIYLQDTYGIKGILFQDSTLTANRKWIISLCEEIIKRKVKFVWSCNTRVDCVDLDLLKLMKKAGCIQVEYGIESGSPKILKLMNKRLLPAKALSGAKLAQSLRIRVGASFMLGNYDEDRQDLEMTFDLAKKLKASYTIFFFAIPFPGTEYWEIAKKRKLIPENVSFGTDWNIRAAELPLMNSNVPAADLQHYRAKFQNYFFKRNYLRMNNLIIGLHLLFIMIKNPLIVHKGVKRVLKYRRLDSFIEEVLVAYRKNLYKYY